jgi:hypothetical protein
MIRLSATALAAGIIAAALAVGAGSSTARATLRVTGADPIQVRGKQFHARERVRVTISFAETRQTRTVRTTQVGGFTTEFDVPVPPDPCTDTLVVTAIGTNGDTAKVKRLPRLCPPPA